VDHILVPLQKIARLLVYFQERFSTLPQRETLRDVLCVPSAHILDDDSYLSARDGFAFIIISTFTVPRVQEDP
jgi:hypothetical protein